MYVIYSVLHNNVFLSSHGFKPSSLADSVRGDRQPRSSPLGALWRKSFRMAAMAARFLHTAREDDQEHHHAVSNRRRTVGRPRPPGISVVGLCSPWPLVRGHGSHGASTSHSIPRGCRRTFACRRTVAVLVAVSKRIIRLWWPSLIQFPSKVLDCPRIGTWTPAPSFCRPP